MSVEKVVIESNSTQPISKSKSIMLFNNIIGYGDVKRLFNLSFDSDKPVHILLVGPPASAKTLFMLECIKLERSFFTLGSHSTKTGMIDYLFEKGQDFLSLTK